MKSKYLWTCSIFSSNKKFLTSYEKFGFESFSFIKSSDLCLFLLHLKFINFSAIYIINSLYFSFYLYSYASDKEADFELFFYSFLFGLESIDSKYVMADIFLDS